MKCLILAGGSGDRLWPLSRKNYPKQFMEIRENRSLLQETVVRNMPYCEEFIIVTNIKYRFIVEGQMKVFQGLKYQCIYEEEARNTAASVTLICMLGNLSERLLVVASDTLIEGKEYTKAVLRGIDWIRQGKLVVLGIPARNASTRFGYIRYHGEDVLEFSEKPDKVMAETYVTSKEYLWNSGMFMICAGDFIEVVRHTNTELFISCKDAVKKIHPASREVMFKREIMQQIPAVSVEKAVFEKADGMKVIQADVCWNDIDELEDMIPYITGKDEKDIILEQCENVAAINRTRKQLLVANQIKDMMIVTTEDVIYVAPMGTSSDSLKAMMQEYHEIYGHYFERNQIVYRSWGHYEILSQDQGFKVKKVTIYPGKTIHSHMHGYRSEHWSMVSGSARITLAGVTKDYDTNESIYVPMGVSHQVSNVSERELVIIEVGIGDTISESDMIHLQEPERETSEGLPADSISKLEPAFKDYLWGGTKLKEQYGKQCDYAIVAESWELSAHEAGQSVIAEGRYKGMLFGEYVRSIRKEALGWKCQAYEEFPILIKFIDARSPLSIQVHPDDEFALIHEGEYGKNEMWYIMDCEDGASLYCGFRHEVKKEQVEEAIQAGTLQELLQEIPVKKGDTVFIPAGTVHAIGRGILICEIQQNSNSTYRLYDYGRRDKYGNMRELHLDKAMQVADFSGSGIIRQERSDCNSLQEYEKQLLGQCKYFECTKYFVKEEAVIDMDDASFAAIVILEGNGVLHTKAKQLSYKKGETFFVPAGKNSIRIVGKSELIVTKV